MKELLRLHEAQQARGPHQIHPRARGRTRSRQTRSRRRLRNCLPDGVCSVLRPRARSGPLPMHPLLSLSPLQSLRLFLSYMSSTNPTIPLARRSTGTKPTIHPLHTFSRPFLTHHSPPRQPPPPHLTHISPHFTHFTHFTHFHPFSPFSGSQSPVSVH